jgi:hypothetical protein
MRRATLSRVRRAFTAVSISVLMLALTAATVLADGQGGPFPK